jgi:hypothetical protein
MFNDIRIIDNALPPQVFYKLQEIIFSDNMSWFFRRTDVGYSSETETVNNYSFHHTILTNGEKNSSLYEIVEFSLYQILSNSGYNIKAIHRMRACLLTTKSENIIGTPHVDLDYPHHSGILYLNDSDGDTIIYNEKYPFNGVSIEAYYENTLNKKVTEKFRVTPKSNKFVLFDGSHYHSVSSPTNCARRVIINFDFTLNE